MTKEIFRSQISTNQNIFAQNVICIPATPHEAKHVNY